MTSPPMTGLKNDHTYPAHTDNTDNTNVHTHTNTHTNNTHTKDILLSFIRDNKMITLANIMLILLNHPLEIVVMSILTSQLYKQVSTAWSTTNNSSVNVNRWSIAKTTLIILLLIFGCHLLLEISAALKDRLDAKVNPMIETAVRNTIVKQVYKKSETNYDQINIAKLIQTLNRLPYAVVELYSKFSQTVIPLILTEISVILLFLWQDLGLGLLLLVLVIIHNAIFWHMINNLDNTNSQTKRENTEVNLYDNLEDTMNNLFNILTSNQINNEQSRFDDLSNKHITASTNELLNNANLKSRMSMVNALILALSLGAILYKYYRNSITSTTAVSLISAGLFFVQYLRTNTRNIAESLLYGTNIKDGDNYLDEIQNKKIDDGSLTTGIKNGKIQFNNVSFGYPDTNASDLVIRDFNYTFNPHQSLLITGPSGCGKSTILKLIMGFYGCTKGTITIDGININDFKKRYLRSKIGYMNQNTKLFNRSIIDNIRYGSQFSRQDALSKINELYWSLDDQMAPHNRDPRNHGPRPRRTEDAVKSLFGSSEHKLVGKNGEHVSGGQRQLILLFRCYLSNKPLILLDEPTSSLDSHLKDFFVNLVKEMMKTKTVIMVAHDPSVHHLFDYNLRMH